MERCVGERSCPLQDRIEDALFAAAAAFPDDIAIVDPERDVSYRELAGLVTAFAGNLTAAGVQPDDRVAIYLDKSLAAVVALYAVWCVGGIVVQANSLLRSRQVGHIVQHCGATVLLSCARLRSRLNAEVLHQCRFIDVASALAEPLEPDGFPGLSRAASERAAIL
jgi:acyl-CoA synthetase (AMP-forming)/AMP-acid ligase II